MTTLFQGLMIVGAGALIINAFWGNISKLWKSQTVTTKINKSIHDNCNHPGCDSLVDIVDCWSHLRDCCETQDLKQAAVELEKIFPLLIVKSGAKDE